MEKKTVCVVTGTRAEYGLLRGVVKKLAQSRTLAVRLVVTGAHLAQEFGMTVREIEADGVPHCGAHPHPEIRHRHGACHCQDNSLCAGTVY